MCSGNERNVFVYNLISDEWLDGEGVHTYDAFAILEDVSGPICLYIDIP